jgi:hypothetical protein
MSSVANHENMKMNDAAIEEVAAMVNLAQAQQNQGLDPTNTLLSAAKGLLSLANGKTNIQFLQL